MITEQYIDYIRQQTSSGVPKDQIHNALILNGLSEEDVAEGFTAVQVGVPSTIATPDTASATPGAQISNNQEGSVEWREMIPKANKGTFIATAIFVFGIDLLILVLGKGALFAFWAEMVGVFVAFCILGGIENFILSKKFSTTKSKLDIWMNSLVVFRNLFVLLNSIPLIQVLGGYVLLYGIVPYLIVYVILIWLRLRQAKPVVLSPA